MSALTFLQANAADATILAPVVQFQSNCTLGSYLLCCVFVEVAAGETITGVGDTKNTWTQIGTVQTTTTTITGTALLVYLFQVASNTSATALQVTATFSGGTAHNAGIAIYEFTGQAASSPLDAFTQTLSATVSNVGTISPVTASQTNEEIIIVGADFGARTISSSANSYTKGVYSNNPSNLQFFEYLGQTSNGSFGDAITFSGGMDFAAWALAVKSTTSQPVGGGNNGNGLLNLLGVN
jgi:hypothetical protein